MSSRVVPPATFSLRLLGGAAVVSGNGEDPGRVAQRKRIALLALLASRPREGVTRERIIGLLWPDLPEARARRLLSDSLYIIRQRLGDDALHATEAGIRLDCERIPVDVVEFERAADAGDLERAADLYGGPFLDGFHADAGVEFERWVDDERTRLARRCATVLDGVIAAAERAGDTAGATAWLRRRVATDPLDAAVTLRLVEALEQSGDAAGALQVARAHEARVRAELDLGPHPDVAAAIARIRDSAPTNSPAMNPSQGLPPSVAVLPFVNLSGDEETECICDGFTEELTAVLATTPGLRVAGRTSAMAFKGRAADVREIAAKLGVSAVVESSVRRSGSRLRVTVQLVDGRDGYHRWARSLEATLTDALEIQAELGREIAHDLRPSLGAGARPSRARARNDAAYAAYVRGVHHTWQQWSHQGGGLLRAVAQFEEALRHDPDYAAAHAGLATVYLNLAANQNVAEVDAYRRARAAATRALALDPFAAEAHLAIGLVMLYADWDWAGAARSVERAIELNPNLVEARLARAWSLAFAGDSLAAVGESARAWELDPLSPATGSFHAYTLYWCDEPARAAAQARHVLELAPDSAFAHQVLGLAQLELGDHPGAQRELDRAVELFPHHPLLVGSRGYVHARTGSTEAAVRALDALERIARDAESLPETVGATCVGRAMVLGALGDTAAAAASLLEAERHHSSYLLALRAYPALRPLLADERVAALARRVGVAETDRRQALSAASSSRTRGITSRP